MKKKQRQKQKTKPNTNKPPNQTLTTRARFSEVLSQTGRETCTGVWPKESGKITKSSRLVL